MRLVVCTGRRVILRHFARICESLRIDRIRKAIRLLDAVSHDFVCMSRTSSNFHFLQQTAHRLGRHLNVRIHVHKLRQKIEKDPANAQLLITEGGGYKLVP